MNLTRITALAALPLSAVLLSGCGGGPVKAGAAALVGDDRISVAGLDQTVRDWWPEFKADPQASANRAEPPAQQQMGGDAASENDVRATLTTLVFLKVGDQAAKDNGVSPSGGDVDQAIALMDQQPNSNAVSTTLAAGLPKDRVRDVARFNAIQLLLMDRFGWDHTRDSPAAQRAMQQFDQALGAAARKLKIQVNPRFGTFDPTRVTINPIVYRLSANESGVR
ncbi:SurA N-terminal domain-containing protein [Actinomadura rupiterrae]|uniref:SurA N-terminal domain-containing protein n=1 Tax=Actinomadura rupiterrae TaxID=559627 RepID=UPI0020A28258|nr:SurA N-terminal domain-containing protein [Actinomadura rupiterrae]MCP2336839.1 hypothetical protein [Actinomadura rupiterrae]